VVLEKSMPPPGSPQAASISDKDRALVAAWVRSGGPLRSSHPAEPQPARSGDEESVQLCLQCHGREGPSSMAPGKIPRIAGQNQDYLKMQLTRYRWRQRVDPSGTMNAIALDLSEAQAEAAARYFAHFDSLAPDVSSVAVLDRELIPAGKALAERACVSCHRNPAYALGSSNPLVPILTGQGKQYLMNCLIEFRNGERSNDLMHVMAKDLRNQDIEALAVYFASLR
jgi:cytochrome c553